jgi:hypothetical protein
MKQSRINALDKLDSLRQLILDSLIDIEKQIVSFYNKTAT